MYIYLKYDSRINNKKYICDKTAESIVLLIARAVIIRTLSSFFVGSYFFLA